MANFKQNYHQLKSDLVNVKHTLSLLGALPKFFRERVTLQQAEAEIKRLLDTRVERFLELVRLQIYDLPETEHYSSGGTEWNYSTEYHCPDEWRYNTEST